MKCRELHLLRALSRKSDLIRSFQVASGPEGTLFTSSASQIAILSCKTIRMKTCTLHSVVGVGDSVKQLNIF